MISFLAMEISFAQHRPSKKIKNIIAAIQEMFSAKPECVSTTVSFWRAAASQKNTK